MTKRVVIIGGGHSAGQCAVSLRQHGWEGAIEIIGEEVYPPYQRPPLSKAFLAGEMTAERLFLKPEEFYKTQNIDLRVGARVAGVNRVAKSITVNDGGLVDYDYLVFATGADVRKLNITGAELAGIGYVRGIDDVLALQQDFEKGGRLAVIGAGYIGLEVAAVARKHGLEVTICELADRVMARVTSPTVSQFFEGLHRGHGVELRLGVGVDGFDGDGRVSGVSLSDGSTIACDFAVAGVGVIPADTIAANAGLPVNDGILVDDQSRTEDPSIFAIGDCTRHQSAYFGGPLRLESVHNALEQAKTAAQVICGKQVTYDQVPWFWSDQYDIKLQTVGISAKGYDREVIRGDIDAKAFSVFYLSGDKIVAVDSINAPADHMASRKLIASSFSVEDDIITDASTPLIAYLKALG